MNKIHVYCHIHMTCIHKHNCAMFSFVFISRNRHAIFICYKAILKNLVVFCRMGLCLELIQEPQRTLLWQTKTAAKYTTFLIIYSEWNEFECTKTCSIREIHLLHVCDKNLFWKNSNPYHYLKLVYTVNCFTGHVSVLDI